MLGPYCLLWHVHSRILCVTAAVYRMHLPRNKHIPKASGYWATLLFHITYCRSAHRMTCFTVCHLIALLLGFSKVRWAWLKFIRKQCCTKLLFLIFFFLPENLLIFLRPARVFLILCEKQRTVFNSHCGNQWDVKLQKLHAA